MPSRSVVIAVALCGCTSAEIVQVTDSTRSVILIEGHGATSELVVHAFDHAGTEKITAQSGTADAFVIALAYDEPLDALALSPDADGLLTLGVDGWPLPPGDHRQIVRRGDLSDAAIASRVAAVRFARPPCFSPQVHRTPLRYTIDTAFAVPLGGGVLFGVKTQYLVPPDEDHVRDPPQVFFVDAAGNLHELGAPFDGTAAVGLVPSPVGFADGDTATVLWNGAELITVNPDLSISTSITTTAAVALNPTRMTVRRVGDRRTILLRDFATNIHRLDESTHRWERVLSPPDPTAMPCIGEFDSVLELSDLTHVLVGFVSGPLEYFNLATPGGRGRLLIDPLAAYCGDAYASLGAAGELAMVAHVETIINEADVLWRNGGESWTQLAFDKPAQARNIGVLGHDAYLTGSNRQLLHLDFDERRPDVLPRSCQDFTMSFNPFYLVPSGDRMFVLGYDARDVVILSRE